MSDVKMSDVFVLPVSSYKGDLFNSENPISDTRVCKFFNMNQSSACNAAKIAINSYDDNQKLIAELQADKERALSVIKAVAHVGVDFGYGKYEIEQEYIDMARAICEQEDV